MVDFTSSTDTEIDFVSSKLGTQEHWDKSYELDIAAFDDVGDVGHIWFGQETQDRLVTWITQKSCLPLSSRILDLGCGNALTLLALREEDFTELTGVDYSSEAIALAEKIAFSKGVCDLNLKICDILQEKEIWQLTEAGKFSMCLDKGTYDAISLRDATSLEDRLKYYHNVWSLLESRGFFLITSCNWTREQLEGHFQTDFELIEELPSPKFTFGGITGQSVTCLVFRRK